MTLAASLFQLPLCFLERLAASRFAAVREGGCQLVQGVGERFLSSGAHAKSCVCRKLKHGRNGYEVRPGWRVN